MRREPPDPIEVTRLLLIVLQIDPVPENVEVSLADVVRHPIGGQKLLQCSVSPYDLIGLIRIEQAVRDDRVKGEQVVNLRVD